MSTVARPPGHYVVPPRTWPELVDLTAEDPIILIPATPVEQLDAGPWHTDIPATPMGVWKFAEVATTYGAADVTVTYARAIVPPHLVQSTKTLVQAYLIDSFAVRFLRRTSPPGTFPYRPGVQGYAMWERRQNKPGATFTTAGAGYRNHATPGQFPGLTELTRLLKAGLL